MKNMKWNVIHYNINRNRIEKFNIFDHWSFRECAEKAAKKYKTKEEFAEQLKRELMYYFWSKAEWELIVRIEDNCIFLIPWCGCRNPEEVKIEITDDASLDWVDFANLHTKKQIYNNEAKIDVHDQVMFEWDKFVDYVFMNGKKL